MTICFVIYACLICARTIVFVIQDASTYQAQNAQGHGTELQMEQLISVATSAPLMRRN